jgi:hypothetical protein
MSAFRSGETRSTPDFMALLNDFSSAVSLLDLSDDEDDLGSIFDFISIQLGDAYLPESFIEPLVRCFLSLSYQQDK